MCGIAGAFAFADQTGADLEGPMAALSALMARRGPDDSGTWSDGRRCALAFRRLSILDLGPSGHQPMLSADGRYALVFNGEIYNFRELRAQLETKGHRYRSTGDTEVLFTALIEWGREALDRLNGMFAIAFYDAREQRLLLGRDHAGIKPLHYAKTDAGVVFGSQYNQLLAHPWMRNAEADPDAVGLYLRFGFVPGPYGLHYKTAQVEAGSFVEFHANGDSRCARFFQFPTWEPPSLRGASALEAFDAALTAAVRRQLVSDAPLGVLLSGGIDSPLVAAEAAKQVRELQAFTIAVDDETMDESGDASMYAHELGLKQQTHRVTSDDALALLPSVIDASTEPSADYSMFPMLAVSRLAADHVKVVLSGDGGDELFWGYPDRFGAAISQAPYFRLPFALRLAAIAARRALRVGHARRDIIRYRTVGDLYRKKHTLFHEADLSRIFPQLPSVPTSFHAFKFDDTSRDRTAQWVRSNEYTVHLARVLQKVDRASMHHSLEVRVPLLDRDVISVASRTDWRSCLDLDERVGKKILREALRRRAHHRTRQKRGFSIPMTKWLTGPLLPMLKEHVVERRSLLGIEMNPRAVAEMLRRLMEGDRSKTNALWIMLSLALWNVKHGDKA